LTYSVCLIYLPYFTYFTYFAYSGYVFNPFWQMVCKGFKLSDEDEDQGQTYMSRQWLSRSPHVGASAATSSTCGIIQICLICWNIWFWKASSFQTTGSCTNIKKYAKYAKYAKYVNKYAIKQRKYEINMSNMQLHLKICRICE
jgi:O-glycosyl hydrolase